MELLPRSELSFDHCVVGDLGRFSRLDHKDQIRFRYSCSAHNWGKTVRFLADSNKLSKAKRTIYEDENIKNI